MKKHLFAAVLLALSTTAFAGHLEEAIDIDFPDELAGFQYGNRVAYPEPGLGASVRYVSANKTHADVYIYNTNLKQIPAKLDSAVVSAQFNQAVKDIQAFKQAGRYSSVEAVERPGAITQYEGCGVQYLRGAFELGMNGRVVSSHVYLTVLNNQFVKLRISAAKDNPYAEPEIRAFTQALRALLGRCRT